MNVLPSISEAWRYGQLFGIGAGGVYEPPTGDSFSHVQFFMPVQGALNYRPLLLAGQVVCDLTCTVRIGFLDTTLAVADGFAQAVDRNQSGGQIKMQCNSETNVAQIALAITIAHVRCPANVPIPLACYQWQSGAGGQGLTFNPIVTGVGIAIHGTWRESLDLGPT